jgi:uncharacterized protein YndB with AHSA1/START domain
MSKQLEHAFDEARKRPEADQDAIAELVFDALEAQSGMASFVFSEERLAEIRASIARGRADVAAGRVTDGEAFFAGLMKEFESEN